MFRNIKLEKKLLYSFFLMILIIVTFGFLIIDNAKKTTELLTKVTQKDIPRLQALVEIKNAVQLVKTQTLKFELFDEVETKNETSIGSLLKYDVLAAMNEVTKWRKEYAKHVEISDSFGLLFLTEIDKQQADIIHNSLAVLELKEQGVAPQQLAEATKILDESEEQITKLLDNIFHGEQAVVLESEKKLIQQSNNINTLSVILILLLFLCLVGIWLLFYYSITKPIVELTNTAKLLSKGDYTARAPSNYKDEIGLLGFTFNEMVDRITKRETVENIFSSMKDGLFVIDTKGKITEVNQAASHVSGFNLKELKGRSINAVLRTQNNDGEIVNLMDNFLMQKLKIQGKIKDFEVEMKVRDSEEFKQVSITASNLMSQTKKIIGAVIVVHDLSELRQLQRKYTREIESEKKILAEAKAKDEAILTAVGDGLVFVGQDMKVKFINNAAETMTGWESDEVIGKSWIKVVKLATENEKKVPVNKTQLVLALKKRIYIPTATFLYTRKDNSKFFAAMSTSPVSVDDDLIGAIIVFRDITNERETERVKTEFISLASHQLRTPLTAIKLFIELLANDKVGKLNKQQRVYIADVSESTERMILLVNELLNVSRFEMGTVRIVPEMTDLESLIAHNIDEAKILLKDKSCSIEFHKPINLLPELLMDKLLFNQVLQNLITNAIRYSSNEKCTIVVTLDSGTQADSVTRKEQGVMDEELLISVADQGIGIPWQAQGKIFEKFFRADNARSKVTEGSGLGLYIAKMIVNTVGGRMWFTSREDKGTTFYITLPRTGMKKGGDVKKLI